MGDMAEIFEIYGEIKRKKRSVRNERYEPLIQALGAIPKSSGVYMLGDWFLYPTKGFAMNRYNYTKKRLEAIIGEMGNG